VGGFEAELSATEGEEAEVEVEVGVEEAATEAETELLAKAPLEGRGWLEAGLASLSLPPPPTPPAPPLSKAPASLDRRAVEGAGVVEEGGGGSKAG